MKKKKSKIKIDEVKPLKIEVCIEKAVAWVMLFKNDKLLYDAKSFHVEVMKALRKKGVKI